ncbi:hypothetical protein [Microbacterium sp. S1037]|uniref:hypothetical protein n=1 Tax=Microbacterium sp. S1037 TaxID=3398227 RepID=UPI003AAD96FB
MTGPMQHLANKGFPRPNWADNEQIVSVEGKPQWHYRAGYLSTRSIQDLAWLMVDGWDVYVHARSSRVTVRIARTEDRARRDQKGDEE